MDSLHLDLAAFSPDGSRLVLADRHRYRSASSGMLVDTRSGKPIRKFRGMVNVKWSADSRTFTAEGWPAWRRVDGRSGHTEALRWTRGLDFGYQWFIDGGKRVGTFSDGLVLVWDAATGEAIEEHTVDWQWYEGNASHSGRRILMFSSFESVSPQIFNLDAPGDPVSLKDEGGGLMLQYRQVLREALRWSHDDFRLAYVEEEVVRVFDTSSGNLLWRVDSEPEFAFTHLLRFVPGSDEILVVRKSRVENKTEGLFLDARTGRPIRRWRWARLHPDLVAFSPDARQAVAFADSITRIDPHSGRELPSNGWGAVKIVHVPAAAFAPDGTYVAMLRGGRINGSTELSLHEPESGRKLASRTFPADITYFDLSADGSTILLQTASEKGDDDGLPVAILDAQTLKTRSTLKADNPPLPKGPKFVQAPGTLKTSAGGTRAMTAVQADGRVTVNYFVMPGRQRLSTWTIAAKDAHYWQLSPDGRSIVADHYGAKTVRILDAETGAVRGTLPGEFGRFSPDNRHLVTQRHKPTIDYQGHDLTLEPRLWDADTLAPISWPESPSAARHFCHVVFSPDGRHFVDVDNQGGIWIWMFRHPHQWWGVAWRPQFWAAVLLGCALLLSVKRDRATVTPSPRSKP
jgi:WD40 repeat protein